MLRFRRKKRDGAERPGDDAPAQAPGVEEAPAEPAEAPAEAEEAAARGGPEPTAAEATPEEPRAVEEGEGAGSGRLFGRLKAGLSRTRSSFAEGMGNLLLGKKIIDETVLEDLETQLLVSDVGVEATTEIVESLTARVRRRQLADPEALLDALHAELVQLLRTHHRPFELPPSPRPFVILVVGVNGVGKTTTIGKLARRFRDQGHTPLLAAGDTFRAAAVEQLQAWGARNDVEVVAQGTGADSASVIFDALGAAKRRGADVVLADTAGRLHNKAGLMEELAKVGRIMKRFDADAPHAVLLVLDAGTGQNALAQAREFGQAVPLTGIVLTKLDGTARGGIAFAIARQTGLPIQFVGVGEQAQDLRPFDPDDFVAALLDRERA
jgi:fused signal recognition particle receptor